MTFCVPYYDVSLRVGSSAVDNLLIIISLGAAEGKCESESVEWRVGEERTWF